MKRDIFRIGALQFATAGFRGPCTNVTVAQVQNCFDYLYASLFFLASLPFRDSPASLEFFEAFGPKNASSIGIYPAFMRGDLDAIIHSMRLDSDRYESFSFAIPHEYGSLAIYTKAISAHEQLLNPLFLLKPLALASWLLFCVFILLTWLMELLVAKFLHRSSGISVNAIVLSTLCTIYGSDLRAILSINRNKTPFHSLEDVARAVRSKEYRLVIEDLNNYRWDMIQAFDHLKPLQEALQINPPFIRPKDACQIAATSQQDDKFIYFGTLDNALFTCSEQDIQRLVWFHPPLPPVLSALMFPKNSKLTQMVNTRIDALIAFTNNKFGSEFRVLERYAIRAKHLRRQMGKNSAELITYVNLWPAGLLLVVGNLCATVGFLGEYFQVSTEKD